MYKVYKICIKNGTVVDWSGTFVGDIYIKDGVICEIGRNLIKDCETIDANENIVMPGFVDLHVHFRDPGYTYKEDIESGSKAAVKGGYVMVNLMANTNPVCSTMETVNYVVKKGKETRSELDQMIQERMKKMLNELNLVTKEDVQRLEQRIAELEQQNKQS